MTSPILVTGGTGTLADVAAPTGGTDPRQASLPGAGPRRAHGLQLGHG
jgi:hypothetical protein